MSKRSEKLVIAFDTSNEVIAIGIGLLDEGSKSVEILASESVPAHRASNTQLLPRLDDMFERLSLSCDDVACVCVGRGPGSFTGVRIAMATAKGIASALDVGLIGLSTQEAIAWGAWEDGVRGRVLVVSDAMRKEVYPAYFDLAHDDVERISPDRVVKATEFADGLCCETNDLYICGDALGKYAESFRGKGTILQEDTWTPTGGGLLLELQSLWRKGESDPLDAHRHDPFTVLPIYTRLSDAEENERARLASPGERNLVTGVQGTESDEGTIAYAPFDSSCADAAAVIEAEVMGTDAWTSSLITDELPRKDRTWWMALQGDELVGYAGALVAGGEAQLLKVAVMPGMRRKGIARELLNRIAYDAENLAAETMSLEVRASNSSAIAFYESLGFINLGLRPHYYSDREDAVAMEAKLPLMGDAGRRGFGTARSSAANGNVQWTFPPSEDCLSTGQYPESPAPQPRPSTDPYPESRELIRPFILAIESSCDETAAAVIDGSGRILSDIVSSQIDFHARFGGVVPEIASRKHVEAIVGVTQLALEEAATSLGANELSWHDLDAVGVTYAPGLVGALVVGVAFAKGAAWAANIPLVKVNHLEGHLYANKLADSFEPPAIVSLLSGGNTMLVYMRDWQDYEILGATIDDAVGEAFDKVAKALGLPYPGGPHISRLAAQGNPDAIDFPRALMHSGDYRFSLSGLKTAVITYINNLRDSDEPLNLPDICASFQQAVIDVQVAKAKRALEDTGAPNFCLGGGVAANPELREAYEQMCSSIGVKVVMPPLSACGDNAAMIALVALDRFKQGNLSPLDQDAFAHADLAELY